MLTPAQWQAKWLTNYQGATTAMTDGANAVTEAPGVKAAAVVTYWLQRIQASATKWAANVAKVTAAEWKAAYIAAGIPNGQAGAARKQANYGNFAQAYYTFLQGSLPTIRAMPNTNIAQAKAKSAAMIDASYAWGQQRI